MKNLFSFNWIAQEEDLSLLSDLTENDASLTGCFRPAIKKFVESHRSFINQANNTHGLGPGHNRGKARVDPDDIPRAG
jgi:hypothetical protein